MFYLKFCISNDQDAFDIRERVLNNGKLKVHITPKYPKVNILSCFNQIKNRFFIKEGLN